MAAPGVQLPSLTGLRFFAAIAVMFYHLHLYFTPISESLALFACGYVGVSFFFILSGFVLTWSHREDTGYTLFYRNRFARIWPLHAVTMILAIWVPPLPTSTESGWLAVPFVLTLSHSWIPASPFLTAFDGVSWSLSCEAFFYLAFPLLWRRLIGVRRLTWTIGALFSTLSLVVLLLGAVSSPPTADYLLGTSPLFRIGEFILGICLAKLMKEGWRPTLSAFQATLFLTALMVVLLIASFAAAHLGFAVPVTVANLVMVPAFLALIAAYADGDLKGKGGVIRSDVLIRLGGWSFALYLIHELVMRAFRQYVADASTGQAFVIAIIVVLTSIAAAGLLHEFVEKPASRALRGGRIRARRQVQHP